MRTVVIPLPATALIAAAGCSSMNPAPISAAPPAGSAPAANVNVTGPWVGTMSYERPSSGSGGTMVGSTCDGISMSMYGARDHRPSFQSS